MGNSSDGCLEKPLDYAAVKHGGFLLLEIHTAPDLADVTIQCALWHRQRSAVRGNMVSFFNMLG
jgi:hypothetical protein